MSDVIIFAVGALISSMVAFALYQIGQIERRVQSKNRLPDGARPELEAEVSPQRSAA